MKISYALTGLLNAKSADGYSAETLSTYAWSLNLMVKFLADKEIEAVTSM